jgi:hypothetical protein
MQFHIVKYALHQSTEKQRVPNRHREMTGEDGHFRATAGRRRPIGPCQNRVIAQKPQMAQSIRKASAVVGLYARAQAVGAGKLAKPARLITRINRLANEIGFLILNK